MIVIVFSDTTASVTTYSSKAIVFTIHDRNPELKYAPQIYGDGENMDPVANKVNSIKHWDLLRFICLTF